MPPASPANSSTNSTPAAKGSRASVEATAAEAFQSRPNQPLDAPPQQASPDQEGRRRLAGAFLIRLDRIEPDPDQPRKRMDEQHIQELAASIQELGVLQPISVRYVSETDTHRIIAGECRYRAALHAGLEEIPCWVRTPEESRILLEQVVENWQRSDLNPFELADSLAILRDSNRYSQNDLAEVTGKSKGEISKILSILDLDPQVQSIARKDVTGRLSKRHLYALKAFEPTRQRKLLSGVIEGRYTAESLETLAAPKITRTETGRKVNWQRRTFTTKHATVSFVFRQSQIEGEDILQALREVRRMIAEDGEQ